VPTHAFTIRKLADAAGVGVEAVRYYQRRGLLVEQARTEGGFREYTVADVQRLRFIKRAQDLGFSLDDIAEITSLSAERDKRLVREITQRRVAEIQGRIAQLNAMASAMRDLVGCCERSARDKACPIIAALADAEEASVPTASATKRRRPAGERAGAAS
jgi:MerR family transcriptional regulator, mercuric resistance operon regulatory protein